MGKLKGICPIANLKHLDYIASTKNLMNSSEVVRLIDRKIRGEKATAGTPPAKQPASSTGLIGSRAPLHLQIHV